MSIIRMGRLWCRKLRIPIYALIIIIILQMLRLTFDSDKFDVERNPKIELDDMQQLSGGKDVQEMHKPMNERIELSEGLPSNIEDLMDVEENEINDLLENHEYKIDFSQGNGNRDSPEKETYDSPEDEINDPLVTDDPQENETYDAPEDEINDPLVTDDPQENETYDSPEDEINDLLVTDDPQENETYDSPEDEINDPLVTDDPQENKTYDSPEDEINDPLVTDDPQENETYDSPEDEINDPLVTDDPQENETYDSPEDEINDPLETYDPLENEINDPLENEINDPLENGTSATLENEINDPLESGTSAALENETNYLENEIASVFPQENKDFLGNELTSPEVYKSTWESLDSRPIPYWYDEAKFGIFIHWGVFSVPGYSSEKFWWKLKNSDPEVVNFMKNNYPAGFEYQDFASNLTAAFFNASKWADLFQASGAQYIVFTSKHHEGFAMFPSNISKMWNSVDIGPHKDIVGLLEQAIRRRTNIKFGLYYSLFEWFHQLFVEDQNNNFETREYVKQKVIPDLEYLVENYKPDILWSDGDDLAPSSYWGSQEFLAWLYNESKVKNTVVTNDRWGSEAHCKHGDVLLCSSEEQSDSVEKRKWEKSASIDRLSWGYRRNIMLSELMSIEEILTLLVRTVSKGGNLLLNIGPTKDGSIPIIFQERLLQIGDWLSVNGEGIYSSKPWRTYSDSKATGVWYTWGNGTVYAFLTIPPEKDLVVLESPIPVEGNNVYIVGFDRVLEWKATEGLGKNGIRIIIPPDYWLTDRVHWVVALKLTNVL